MIFEACTVHDLLELDMQQMDFPRSDLEGMAHHMVDPNLSCVMRGVDGSPLACFGLKPMWPGVAEAWSFLSEKSLKHPVALSRAVKKQLRTGQIEHGFRRVQCLVKEDHIDGHRWAQWLGFEPEGRLANYGYGGNGVFWIYARCEGEN